MQPISWDLWHAIQINKYSLDMHGDDLSICINAAPYDMTYSIKKYHMAAASANRHSVMTTMAHHPNRVTPACTSSLIDANAMKCPAIHPSYSLTWQMNTHALTKTAEQSQVFWVPLLHISHWLGYWNWCLPGVSVIFQQIETHPFSQWRIWAHS